MFLLFKKLQNKQVKRETLCYSAKLASLDVLRLFSAPTNRSLGSAILFNQLARFDPDRFPASVHHIFRPCARVTRTCTWRINSPRRSPASITKRIFDRSNRLLQSVDNLRLAWTVQLARSLKQIKRRVAFRDIATSADLRRVLLASRSCLARINWKIIRPIFTTASVELLFKESYGRMSRVWSSKNFRLKNINDRWI